MLAIRDIITFIVTFLQWMFFMEPFTLHDWNQRRQHEQLEIVDQLDDPVSNTKVNVKIIYQKG